MLSWFVRVSVQRWFTHLYSVKIWTFKDPRTCNINRLSFKSLKLLCCLLFLLTKGWSCLFFYTLTMEIATSCFVIDLDKTTSWCKSWFRNSASRLSLMLVYSFIFDGTFSGTNQTGKHTSDNRQGKKLTSKIYFLWSRKAERQESDLQKTLQIQ